MLRKAQEVLRLQRGGVPAGPAKPSTEADAHAMAKDAIKKGKDPAAVNKRLQEWGYKPL